MTDSEYKLSEVLTGQNPRYYRNIEVGDRVIRDIEICSGSPHEREMHDFKRYLERYGMRLSDLGEDYEVEQI